MHTCHHFGRAFQLGVSKNSGYSNPKSEKKFGFGFSSYSGRVRVPEIFSGSSSSSILGFSDTRTTRFTKTKRTKQETKVKRTNRETKVKRTRKKRETHERCTPTHSERKNVATLGFPAASRRSASPADSTTISSRCTQLRPPLPPFLGLRPRLSPTQLRPTTHDPALAGPS